MLIVWFNPFDESTIVDTNMLLPPETFYSDVIYTNHVSYMAHFV